MPVTADESGSAQQTAVAGHRLEVARHEAPSPHDSDRQRLKRVRHGEHAFDKLDWQRRTLREIRAISARIVRTVTASESDSESVITADDPPVESEVAEASRSRTEGNRDARSVASVVSRARCGRQSAGLPGRCARLQRDNSQAAATFVDRARRVARVITLVCARAAFIHAGFASSTRHDGGTDEALAPVAAHRAGRPLTVPRAEAGSAVPDRGQRHNALLARAGPERLQSAIVSASIVRLGCVYRQR